MRPRKNEERLYAEVPSSLTERLISDREM